MEVTAQLYNMYSFAHVDDDAHFTCAKQYFTFIIRHYIGHHTIHFQKSVNVTFNN